MVICFQVAGKLGSSCDYIQGFWEQPHSSGDLGSHAESKNEYKNLTFKKAYVSFEF